MYVGTDTAKVVSMLEQVAMAKEVSKFSTTFEQAKDARSEEQQSTG